MTKTVLIIEKNQNSLQINEGNEKLDFLKEYRTKYKDGLVVGGIFTEFDITNRNNRVYTAQDFVPCMNKMMEKKKSLGILFGEYNHPEGFDININQVSHCIVDLK